MLFFSSICAICIFGEVVISNEIVMYVVSVIYGIGAAGLITIVPPILMTYKTEENRNFIVYNRAINIISLTIGALLAGLLTGKQFSISIKNVLLIVPILYIVSIIVFTLHDNIASKSREKSKERNFYLKKVSFGKILDTYNSSFSMFMDLHHCWLILLMCIFIIGIILMFQILHICMH